ncbi:probable leucine-rich repeat receptor-like serine/threonine-protein kinase At3g14840 [Morus notabilis]|uniref:probable leucine-rich repeat receptor-like serine/threonine-protein kinase At3g14840 n=1 Tax=Morus notabilis TaxID=981085 RepID=UPI000CED0982|nr:probable leucine-rich repeat receptor-like serine/threonine-protein kinase At3g14840 [Morus notabilis]
MHVFLSLSCRDFSGQDLDGVLPPSVAKLPYLKKLNLGQNYLSGSIPREWASTKLEFLVVSVNNLSGPIPGFLGNITTLKDLGLESNLFSGTIPPEIGKLVNLETVFLSANNLTGEWPVSLTKLTKLRTLRISSNNFTGKIPDFFQSWKQLENLEMQSSGFEGPIPSGLSVLSNLTEIRISDLHGESSEFTDLRNMTNVKKLMLRSCNIRGRIPEYLSTLTSLTTLDLSFNRLEGDIPNLENLMGLSTLYLTSNLLTGLIPNWVNLRDNRYVMDLSYNNFSEASVPPACRETYNLFRSFPQHSDPLLSPCLSPCPKDQYSLHINCGGKQITIGNIKYEGDEDPGGAAKFVHNTATWGFSSTGDFWDIWSSTKDYIANNVSVLRMNNSELYTTARLSPLSLAYYARCLANGNYTVKLHFSEILYRDNRSYYSVGRRMFDVYIQGERVLEDFNIEEEANGVDKEVIKLFKACVNNKTLEIRFQWTGKGTTNAPKRGMYGSLISAISMEADFKPPDENKTKKIIVAGVLSALCLIFMILGVLWWKGYLGGRPSREQVLKGLDLQTGFFTFRQIKAATNNFDAANKLGEGGFGSVYKGVLLDGTIIAVKQLSSRSKQGNREFVNEIGMISALQHPNLVKLHGCCIEGKQLLLVYEYMENNNLALSLFGPKDGQLKLDWPTRQKICVGVARGLAFLHEESPLKIVHRDIKATNILLDRDLNPKISDFGLAKLDEEENTHITTRVAGTIGYMAPEYALWGYLTFKADVYSFGIVALELVAGISNTKFGPDEDYVCLLDWALVSQQKGKLMRLVDPRLGSDFNTEEAARMIKVALQCTNPSPALRPTMSAVVSMLEGRTLVHELVMDPSVYADQLRFQALTEYIDHLRSPSSRESASFLYSSSATRPSSSSFICLYLYGCILVDYSYVHVGILLRLKQQLAVNNMRSVAKTNMAMERGDCIINTKTITLLLFVCTALIKAEAQVGGTLPNDEVEAIEEIAEQLNKKDWNLSDPCSNKTTIDKPRTDQYSNIIDCNCSISANVCHVQKISFTGQDLDGVLPPSLAKLPYLKEVNLVRNYLSGSIPREWASTKLERLIISINNLGGQIPGYLGNITTLRSLSVESNFFNGTVPSELGKLVNLERLILGANNLTGQFPLALTNLSKLNELRISSNNFTGRMPDFGGWKQLQKLEMQASGFEGPIPSSLSLLSNLTELRISDLNGESSDFPDLTNMTNLETLMLRSCNLRGRIPENIRTLESLSVLDLSFNKLEGEIPDFENIMRLDTLYLTSNLLNGSIPEWLKSRDSRYQIDISYNNFSETSEPSTCRDTFNFFRSSSALKNNSILSKCLSKCSKDYYSVHINCGGKQTTIGNIKYEGDEDPGGQSKFVHSAAAWGFSSTGDFMDVWSTTKDYIANNVSVLRMNNSHELYTTARLSPLSITYYARCLANGNYTVKLHFAEIVLRDNRSYYGVGRRMFDVHVQGKLVLEDFNIEEAANGVDKEVIREVKAVVSNKTLEIRFYWAGKGTTNVPRRGTYGSLISAISVKSDFEPPNESNAKKYIIIGVVSAVCLLFIVLGILWWKGCFGGKTSREQVMRGLDLQTGFFTFRQIKAATNNFDAANKIGEGGFGSVYKGVLLDGTIIAVKQLSSKSKQGNREFVNEIGMISALQHPNLVKLHGCCIEGKQLLLVYEYMENNSLAHSLFGEGGLKLDWKTRQRICIGIAKGLAFLHEESTLKIVHRDIKATNILLDGNLNPKISDFGLAKLNEEENTHISTRVAGTIGYMAPEYALWGYLTDKADVYSFGVLALEIVAGKNNMRYRPNENFVCLLDWAIFLQQKGNLMDLVDPKSGSEFNKEEANRMIKVALLCTNPSQALRPGMSEVVSMLEGRTAVHELIMDPSNNHDPLRFNALRDQFDQISQKSSGQSQSVSTHSSSVTRTQSSFTSDSHFQ